MHYYKMKKIGRCIIKNDDITTMTLFLNDLAQQNGGDCTFCITFFDGTVISDNQVASFSSASFIRKEPKEISLAYYSERLTSSVNIRLEETFILTGIENMYEVSSEEEMWFNAACNKLTDIINGIQKKHWFRCLFSFPWIIFSCVIFLLLASLLMVWPLGFEFGEKSQNAAVFIPISSFVLLCFIVFSIISIFVHWLCPEVEFAFNTHRYIRRKKLRKALGWMFSTILIPIILSIIMR